MQFRSLTFQALIFALGIIAASAEESSPFLRQLQQEMPKWDQNSDGMISLAEIDQAIANPAVKGTAAITAAALRRGMSSTDKRSTSPREVQSAVEKHKADSKSLPDYEGLYRAAESRLEKANRQLFASSPPQVGLLKQGKLGDCFCIAALRTMLQRDPTEITRMIMPQADASYVVRIGNKDIPTPAPTDAEIILGSSTADGLWPLIYEKAVGISKRKPDAKDATPFSVVTKGGSAGEMMSKLTAHEIKRWSCKDWRSAAPDTEKQKTLLDSAREQLKSAFHEKRLVTGGTAGLAKGKNKVPGITYNHGYAILGYDAAKDVVHLWNPHANDFTPKGEAGLEHGYPMQKGEFFVPLTELVTFFGGFAFEQQP